MQWFLFVLTVVAQLWLSPHGVAGCARSLDSQVDRQEAVLAALVALHTGANCNSPRPQGARQLAALHEAVSVVNTYGGIPIGMRVYDTCSSPENAVKATLKALVAAEEDTCLQPPFFLGFVGPDDAASVEAVSRVVHVFNLTHVAPWRLSRPPWLRDHTLHVANTHHDRTAQAVLTMMHQAGWTSFLAAHTGSANTARKTKMLLQMVAGSDVCSMSPALQLPTEDVISKLQQGSLTPSGVVLVVDTWGPVVDFLSRLPASLVHLQILVVTSDTQLPSPLPASVNVSVVLLLETAGVHLAPGFEKRLQSDVVSKVGVPEDMSVAPLAHAVRLYGAAMRAAQAANCPDGTRMHKACLGPEEWHAMMAGASVLADDVSPDMISFSTDLPTLHRVYLAEEGVALRWVGNITDSGKKLHLTSSWSLPTPLSAVTCSNDMEEVVQTSSMGNLWPGMTNEHGFYQAVGMLAGAGTGLVGLLILCTWVVYRSFRVPGKSRSPPSSVSSYTRRS